MTHWQRIWEWIKRDMYVPPVVQTREDFQREALKSHPDLIVCPTCGDLGYPVKDEIAPDGSRWKVMSHTLQEVVGACRTRVKT